MNQDRFKHVRFLPAQLRATLTKFIISFDSTGLGFGVVLASKRDMSEDWLCIRIASADKKGGHLVTSVKQQHGSRCARVASIVNAPVMSALEKWPVSYRLTVKIVAGAVRLKLVRASHPELGPRRIISHEGTDKLSPLLFVGFLPSHVMPVELSSVIVSRHV